MLFLNRNQVNPTEYLILVLLLNAVGRAGYQIKIGALYELASIYIPKSSFEKALDNLWDLRLVVIETADDTPRPASDLNEKHHIELTWLGLATLINYANDFIDEINDEFDLSEDTVATLLLYLDLGKVPAADRYVSVNDNSEDFARLREELERITDEITKDDNSGKLPIPHKKQVVADLRGFIAQIKGGYVRLSDMTQKIRPLLHSMAETCKDIIVISTAAATALALIENIIRSLF